MKAILCELALALFFIAASSGAAAESNGVVLLRTPDGGIQPQAAIDASGTVHLIYYKGDAAGGDLFYVRRPAEAKEFSAPIPVNSQRGSAIAAGSIRGAQLAVGRNGRVHVAWDGMGRGAKKVTIDGKEAAPLLYTRLNDAGTAFEPERNVITYATGLDGGSAIAADAQGNVYVAWHGNPPGNQEKEAGRAVFVARSRDDGKTFERERPALSQKTGACACCGMRAFVDRSGAVYVIFRAATANVERGATIAVARDTGAPFEPVYSHPWKAMQCPMSSMSLADTSDGVLAAWETGDNVYFATIPSVPGPVIQPTAPLPGTKRKHPVAVANGRGETLLAWTEGTGWGKGGSVVWQIYDRSGKPAGERGRVAGLPAWSLLTAWATPDGRFVIVY